MITLYRDGATLEEIGAVYGVTRERARQVIAQVVRRGTGIDPIKTINVCRKAQSLTYAAHELGGNSNKSKEIKAFLIETGYWPAMARLWAWRRKQAYQTFSDEQLLDKLRALAGKLGHTPGIKEVNADPDMPSHTTYVHRWGNWAPACAAAGLTPMKAGARGHKNRDPNTGRKAICKRGHSLLDETNLYVWRGHRVCRQCSELKHQARRQKLIDAGKLIPRARRTRSLFTSKVIAAREVA